MVSTTPSSEKEVKVDLVAETKGLTEGEAVFYVEWLEDELEKTESNVDKRIIPKCAVARPTKPTPVSGDKTTLSWPVSWDPKIKVPHPDEKKAKKGKKVLQITTNEKEIYAVIRAEYRFIKDNGWKKICAKKKSQGFDNLFIKTGGGGTTYAVVESKFHGNTGEYEKWIKEPEMNQETGESKKPWENVGINNPINLLKKNRPPRNADRKIIGRSATQMSSVWESAALMREAVRADNEEVFRNLSAYSQWKQDTNGRPKLWLNVYGAEWLYLLRGEYDLRCRVKCLTEDSATNGRLTVEFSDDPWKPYEFFCLDSGTKSEPGMKGPFHDLVDEFGKRCADDLIDPDAAKAKEAETAAALES